MPDRTLTKESAFGSEAWVYTKLGLSRDKFRAKKIKLQTADFPKPDSITGLWIKADVLEWIDRRRQLKNCVTIETSYQGLEINEDAI